LTDFPAGQVAHGTSDYCPLRHLMRRSDPVALGGEVDMARTPQIGRSTQSGRWMLAESSVLTGRESYLELRLEPLYCPIV